MDKPNIILYITHDQGQFLGCYNSQTPNSLNTPNLDKIAENGVRFTNYFCTAPQCSPSRGGIQTALYPHQNGLMGLLDRGWKLLEENKTLPMYLKENGYTTHLIGFQHETFNAYTLGYDTISKRKAQLLYTCKRLKRNYSDFFESHKDDDKPFYLCIGDVLVHRPFGLGGNPVDPNGLIIPPYLPDNKIVREDLSQFYGAVECVDKCVGTIVKQLNDLGLSENTLFIYTTDHGEAYPRAKCTLYDPGLKTLLIMSWLGSDLLKKKKVYNQMISNIDLLPTLLDIIGAEIPSNIEGRSFLPLLKDDIDIFREEIYSEKSFHEFYDPLRAIRTEEFKYIINFEKSEYLYQIGADMQRDAIGQYMLERIKELRPKEELYNLKKDPNEFNNLVDDPNYKAVVGELKDKLYDWMKSTNDPLLKGKINDLCQKAPNRF